MDFWGFSKHFSSPGPSVSLINANWSQRRGNHQWYEIRGPLEVYQNINILQVILDINRTTSIISFMLKLRTVYSYITRLFCRSRCLMKRLESLSTMISQLHNSTQNNTLQEYIKIIFLYKHTKLDNYIKH